MCSTLYIFYPCVSLPPFQLLTLAHCLLLNHRCKIPVNESHSLPPPQPPHLSFPSFPFPFSFLLLAIMINTYPQPHRIITPSIHSLAPIPSILLTFFYTF